MAKKCVEMARLWVETYGEEIHHLPLSKLVEIANQCIETGLVPDSEKLGPEDGDCLLNAIRVALAEAAHARAEAEAALPALTGTPKQVLWAKEIRSRAINTARMLRQRAKQQQDERVAARLDDYLVKVLQKKSSALWFINNRWAFIDFPGIVRRVPEMLPEDQAQASDFEQDARAEMTIYPVSGTQYRRTELAVSDDGLLLMHPQDFIFLGVVSRHHLKWDPVAMGWRVRSSLPGESIADRAAALPADLLKEGYAVMVGDDVTREKAQEIAREWASE